MKISIIIVNYNTRDLLHACLRSIMTYARLFDFEIIVIDNASNDSSVEMVQKDFPTALLIPNSLNIGFAKAVNQGLQIASGAYYLLINSDAELINETLKSCLELFDTHPDAGIVGCKLLNSDGSVQPSCESFPDLWGFFSESFFLEKIFPWSTLFGRMHLTYFGHDRVARVDCVKGAFMMVRRETVQDIGFLDEDFFFYAEEMDWCYQAIEKGWHVYFTPDAQVIHHGGRSSDPISPQMFVQLHKSRFQFFHKHHSAMESGIARFLLAIGALLRFVGWSLIAAHCLLLHKSSLDFARKKVIAFRAAFLWYVGFGESSKAQNGDR